MPLYDYQCEKCGHIFEVLELKEEDNKERKCPKCQSTEVKKLPAAFARLGFGCGSGGFFT